jgi:hypothetical protein
VPVLEIYRLSVPLGNCNFLDEVYHICQLMNSDHRLQRAQSRLVLTPGFSDTPLATPGTGTSRPPPLPLHDISFQSASSPVGSTPGKTKRQSPTRSVSHSSVEMNSELDDNSSLGGGGGGGGGTVLYPSILLSFVIVSTQQSCPSSQCGLYLQDHLILTPTHRCHCSPVTALFLPLSSPRVGGSSRTPPRRPPWI